MSSGEMPKEEDSLVGNSLTDAARESCEGEVEEGGGPTPKMKFDYAFDNFMVKPWASFFLIGVLTILNIIFGGLLLAMFDPTLEQLNDSLWEAMWIAW